MEDNKNVVVEEAIANVVEETVKNKNKAMIVTALAFTAGIGAHVAATKGIKVAKRKISEMKNGREESPKSGRFPWGKKVDETIEVDIDSID